MRFVLALLLLIAGPAEAACRLALALGLDVSGSVDDREYRLQLDGLAQALSDSSVQDALLAIPDATVRLAVFEWSDTRYQRMLLDWAYIRTAADVGAVVRQLMAVHRTAAPPATALGQAMVFGAALLERETGCWSRVLDLSGDGRHNTGPHPRDVKLGLLERPLTVNALAIGSDAPRPGDNDMAEIGALASYFRAWVILGPDAFVETALGFEDFRAAMTRKLLRELETPSVAGKRPTRPQRRHTGTQRQELVSGPLAAPGRTQRTLSQ